MFGYRFKDNINIIRDHITETDARIDSLSLSVYLCKLETNFIVMLLVRKSRILAKRPPYGLTLVRSDWIQLSDSIYESELHTDSRIPEATRTMVQHDHISRSDQHH